jgi:hypothetical protein
MKLGGMSCASSHAFGVTLLEGGACSSRPKAAPRGQRSLRSFRNNVPYLVEPDNRNIKFDVDEKWNLM